MALNIRSPEVDRMARDLAAATGETLTTAVETALRERLDRERDRSRGSRIARRLRTLGEEVRTLPVIDPRDTESIMGYDEHGLPS